MVFDESSPTYPKLCRILYIPDVLTAYVKADKGHLAPLKMETWGLYNTRRSGPASFQPLLYPTNCQTLGQCSQPLLSLQQAAQCHLVPVAECHLLSVSLQLEPPCSLQGPGSSGFFKLQTSLVEYLLQVELRAVPRLGPQLWPT